MIPADVASRLRLITPEQPAPPQPVTPARQLTDVLSELVPGQRVLAEIQALLPNGTYRAIIAQRDVTLALPFSAKPGDALELEVVESDGKLTLAFVANRNPSTPGAQAESVSATLSPTGQLIGDLLGGIDEKGRKPLPLALNGNQPLIGEFPEDASQLAPVLKDALSKSGMFYEAHQARWVEGRLTTSALLQEPQGKLSAALQAQHASQPTSANVPNQGGELVAATASHPAKDMPPPATGSDAAASQKTALQTPIPADLTPLVRQQLDALATQTYVWQGQVWPGQQMHWEIEEDAEGRRDAQEEGASGQWQTRLQLTLPGLGGIDAVMRLRAGGTIDLTLVTDSDQSRQTLTAASDGLRRQLDDAGLSLTGLIVRHDETTD